MIKKHSSFPQHSAYEYVVQQKQKPTSVHQTNHHAQYPTTTTLFVLRAPNSRTLRQKILQRLL